MPDVWTNNPEKLRGYLVESGSRCGVPGRVLTGRDPEWTCTYDSKGWLRDIYIHPAAEIYLSAPAVALFVLFFGAGVLAGLLWGKRFWHREL
ncbi:MAG: hypothetical protein RL417_402 [Pseudomonadota bacterium]|jgi:hypothetical protein